MNELVKTIEDERTIEFARSIARQALDSPWEFNRKWLLERDWYPVVDEGDFPTLDDEVENFIQTLKALKIKELFAVNIEGARAFPKVVSIPCTLEGYRALIKELSIIGLFVFDEKLQFALLTTHDDFYIIASSFKTVQGFFDGQAFEVILKYRESMMKDSEPYRTNGLLRYEQCRFFFDLAKPEHEK